MQNDQEELKKFREIVGQIKFAMLTTVESDGRLFSRPMGAQHMDENGDLWFFTRRSSGKCEAVQTERQVNVAYASPDDSTYLSVSGSAQLVDDRAKAESMWNPILKAWFPKGLEDPELVLLKVQVESAEFWDSPSSKIVQLVGFAKAIVTGQPYKAGPDENNRIDFRH